ncbi:MAG: hypothetical protein AB8I08_26035 [Sandaracinaceae bacterium]
MTHRYTNVLCALVLFAGCADGEDVSPLRSGLDGDRAVADLDAAEIQRFCEQQVAWITEQAGPDSANEQLCLYSALRESDSAASCEPLYVACLSERDPVSFEGICDDATPKPECDPRLTVSILEACYEASLAASIDLDCSYDGTDEELQERLRPSGPDCLELAGASCNLFAP